MTMHQSTQLRLHFEPIDEDRELAEQALRETQNQLSRLGVRAVRPQEKAPADSKSGAIDLLTLALDIAPWAGLLGGILNAAVHCLKRRKMKSVIIEMNGDRLELRGPWSDEKQRIVDKWIEAHSKAEEDGEE
ncbi:hypothetical protein ABT269_39660 [Streptomyces viridosporus]|uniref:hypothetical protein n=1 Tax=Streptomyces viridosporus TaxID=67581 RepID=UPI00332F46AC